MTIHAELTDKQRQSEAKYQLEVCFEKWGYGPTKVEVLNEISDRLWATHYIVQSMLGGHTPKNYDEVIMAAMVHDARDITAEAIYFAKGQK